MQLIIILLMSVLDMLLTHYQFFLDNKKGVLDMRVERNWLPRMIMGKKPTPKNFILGSIVSLSIIAIAGFLGGDDVRNAIFGIYLLLNYIHWISIMDRKLNWNNKKYWNLHRLARKIKKVA